MLRYLICLFSSVFVSEVCAMKDISSLRKLETGLAALSERNTSVQQYPQKPIVDEHPSTEYRVNGYTIRLIVQNILQQPADAIVNAANEPCLGGGGIDSVISKAGGEYPTKGSQYTTLYDLRFALRPDKGIRCPEGDARITRGGWLQYPSSDPRGENNTKDPRQTFNYVIHAVGPNCKSTGVTPEKKKTLVATYLNTLKRVDTFNKKPRTFKNISIQDLGKNYQIKVLSFPPISTGLYGCSVKETAKAVIDAVINFLEASSSLTIREINFVFWPASTRGDYEYYREIFDQKLRK